MSHIFISYSKKDIDQARYVRTNLQKMSISTWMDEERLETGDEWIKSIKNAIKSANAVIVLMSHNSEESTWVNREIQYAEDLKKPIYPILINGQPFFRLRDLQYETIEFNSDNPLSNRFLAKLRNIFSTTRNSVKLYIKRGDVLQVHSDVLVLKYAQSFYGADLAVARHLKESNIRIDVSQIVDKGYLLLDTKGAMNVKYILFISTRNLHSFDYTDVRSFVSQALQILQMELSSVKSVTFTIHGVNIGLDESETLRAQLGGILDALEQTRFNYLNEINIVEVNPNRCAYLKDIARSYLGEINLAHEVTEDFDHYYLLEPEVISTEKIEDKEVKVPSIVTFFPMEETLADFYHYGILRPAGMQGFICENLGLSINLNNAEEVEKLNRFIERSKLALVYVSDVNFSLSLAFQLGMAYGKGKSIVYITNQKLGDISTIRFTSDIQLIHYVRISDLETAILQLLKSLDND